MYKTQGDNKLTIPVIEGPNGQKYSHFVLYKKGGMGEIYKGYEENTKENVVIKLIAILDSGEEELLLRELNACKSFSHENLVKTYLTGKIDIDGLDYLYIIQKYYPNGNLRSQIVENTPIEKCFSMFNAILSGMEEIHRSIIHRDLKPENILVDINGHLAITDFGISKYIDEKTRTKSFKGYGTTPYMAPECWMGDSNTIAMDIYALGIIFFEILTGRHPYKANNDEEWRNCHIFELIPNISTYRSDINTKLNQIIQKMTAKKPIERFNNISEIKLSLNDAMRLQLSNSQDIEYLAAMGNAKMQQVKASELKVQQEAQKMEEQIKLLNYHITELFDKVIEKVNAINERLETGKIAIQKSSEKTNDTNRTLKLIFNEKGVTFKFTNFDSVDKYNKRHYDDSIKFQKERNQGFIMQSPRKTYLEENSFVLVGLAETTFKIGTIEYGFNLLLKKLQNENYGTWYKMVFSENVQPAKTSFGINLPVFFTEYEKLIHSSWHSMKNNELNDDDIMELLRKIMM